MSEIYAHCSRMNSANCPTLLRSLQPRRTRHVPPTWRSGSFSNAYARRRPEWCDWYFITSLINEIVCANDTSYRPLHCVLFHSHQAAARPTTFPIRKLLSYDVTIKLYTLQSNRIWQQDGRRCGNILRLAKIPDLIYDHLGLPATLLNLHALFRECSLNVHVQVKVEL